METNVIKVEHTKENDVIYSGYLQLVGYDYEADEKDCTVSINGSPYLRRDDPELKKYQFPNTPPNAIICKL
jgi:hypothetical protein